MKQVVSWWCLYQPLSIKQQMVQSFVKERQEWAKGKDGTEKKNKTKPSFQV